MEKHKEKKKKEGGWMEESKIGWIKVFLMKRNLSCTPIIVANQILLD